MRLTRLIAGALSASLLGLVPLALAAAPAQAADYTTTTVLQASYKQVEFNGNAPGLVASVKRSDGTSVYAGTVNLHAKVAGGKWKKIRSANAGGYVSFSDVKPKQNTTYRVFYSGGSDSSNTYQASRSGNRKVNVARKITGKTNSKTFVVKGKVTPKFKKKRLTVKVSKKEKKGYKNFKKIKTNKKGRYKIKLPRRKGTFYYRIIVPKNKKFATNYYGVRTWVY